MTNCTGTEYLTDEAAKVRAAEIGVHAPAYGRKMCAKCDGLVFLKRDGTLAKHKRGSNRIRVR